MIKVDRITIRIRGGNPLNPHQGARLARAVGESLAGAPSDGNVTIDRIGLAQAAPPNAAPETLAGPIGRRILSRIGRR